MSRFYYLIFLGVLSLALTVRFGVWFTYSTHPASFVAADTTSYLEPGRQLLTEGTFSSFMRTPVYPLFLGALDLCWPSNQAVWALTQVCLSIITIAMTGWLVHKITGPKAAAVAMLFIALDVPSAITANQLMSETLFTLLLVLCLLGVAYVWRKGEAVSAGSADTLSVGSSVPDGRWPVRASAAAFAFALCGLLFSIMALCRPIGFLLCLVVSVWLVVVLKSRRRRTLLIVSCFIACSLLMPACWIVRNHARTGEYFLSTIVAINMYEYRAAWNVSQSSGRSFDEIRSEFEQEVRQQQVESGMNPGQLAKWELAKGIEVLQTHPLMTLAQGCDGLVKMYLGISMAGINELARPTSAHSMADSESLVIEGGRELLKNDKPWWIRLIKYWALFFLLALYAGVLLCFVLAWRGKLTREQRQFAWLLFGVIAYFTFFSVGAETYSRFRVPITPLLAALAAIGWVRMIEEKS